MWQYTDKGFAMSWMMWWHVFGQVERKDRNFGVFMMEMREEVGFTWQASIE